MSTIQLLTFDLDDTLWDVRSIVLRADAAMMRWLGENYPKLAEHFDQSDFMALRAEVYQQNPGIRHDLGALRRQTLELALHRSGHSESECEIGARAAFDVFFHERNIVEFFPGVIPTLEALKQQYPLYALSNGGADIAHMGLGHIFSLHLSAAAVGAAKPDPAMYLKALEHAGIDPANAIHIGDHPEQDVEAAQKVGMKTIWVNFQDKPWPLEQRADGELKAFEQLPELVARIASGQ